MQRQQAQYTPRTKQENETRDKVNGGKKKQKQGKWQQKGRLEIRRSSNRIIGGGTGGAGETSAKRGRRPSRTRGRGRQMRVATKREEIGFWGRGRVDEECEPKEDTDTR